VNLYNQDINGYEVIKLINEDYPRGGVPSPGFVGGPCLSKDVYMFNGTKSEWTDLNFIARLRNEGFIEWAARISIELYKKHSLSGPIGIIGGAFKGTPQTNDWRNSPALIIVKILNEVFANPPIIYDQFPPNVQQQLSNEKFIYTNSTIDLLNKCSLVLIQNNNFNWLSESLLNTINSWPQKLLLI
jgi:UDP-N-acetyl-D-mannosaminuronate dehydrogenase